MLVRASTKMPIVLLLVFTALALALTLAAITYTAIRSYIGFQMTQSSTFMCSVYLTIKVELAKVYIFNMVFVFSIISCSIQLSLVLFLIKLLINFLQQQQKQEQQSSTSFPQSAFLSLYILLSLTILTIIPPAAYFITYLLQKDILCQSFINLDHLILALLTTLSLLFLLAQWIYLFVYWLQSIQKFEQSEDEDPNAIVGKVQKMQDDENRSKGQKMKNLLKEMMMAQNLQNLQNDSILKSARQPLLEVEEEDKISIQEEIGEKLVYMTYKQFRKKEEQKLLRENERQARLKELLKIQEEKVKIKIEQEQKQQKINKKFIKQTLAGAALSSNDPNLDKLLQQSQQLSFGQGQEGYEKKQRKKQEQVEEGEDSKINKQKLVYYPANYVPQTPEDKKKFQQYKNQLLSKQLKINQQERKFKHPQNLTGGRSKKAMNAFLSFYKRPVRDESMYLNQSLSPDINSFPVIEEQSRLSESQVVNIDPSVYVLKPITASQTIDPILNQDISKPEPQRPVNNEQELCFHRQRLKIKKRKKLFEESNYYDDFANNRSILSSLGKIFVEVNSRHKLNQIKSNKFNGAGDKSEKVNSRNRKGEVLIEYIRAKAET